MTQPPCHLPGQGGRGGGEGKQEVGSGPGELPSPLATPSRGALIRFLVPSLTDALEGSC